jgi:hypothetical protein
MIRKILFITIIITGSVMSQDFELAKYLYDKYEDYCENSLDIRRFKHSDIVPLIERLKNNNIYKVNKAGKSAQGRDIYLISLGNGPTKVFLWSQMHGDEPTATMALFDIFNFLNSGDRKELKEELLSKLSIYIMPMVNPDGAEAFERRNSANIDINRDAVRQQTPEGRLLRGTFEDLKAEFGFNLHDQSPRYSVGNSFRAATLSFLAPTTNYDKGINDVREKAIKLIGIMFRALSTYIPGHIAKYSDEFEPRAFGDNFQKWGTSTILIESGGWPNDPEKQFIRKMNFIGILTALKSIADESYKNEPIATYESIPFNDKFIMDCLLKNLTYRSGDSIQTIDIGINREEKNKPGAKDFYFKSVIEDLGDLSVFYGYEEHDLSGMEVVPGKTYNNILNTIEEVKNLDFALLHSEGYTNVMVNSDSSELKYVNLPINIITDKKPVDNNKLVVSEVPNFIIKKDGKVKYAVVNGFLYNPEKPEEGKGNGLILP